MKSTGQHDWTQLLGPCPVVPFEPALVGLTGSVPASDQQERIADSKLDRLAAELRALGIQF